MPNPQVSRRYLEVLRASHAHHIEQLLAEESEIGNAEHRCDILASVIRIETPSIPDIDLDRYTCPECGSTLGVISGKHRPDTCHVCAQRIDWGFLM